MKGIKLLIFNSLNIRIKMGNSQSLSAPISNSKFNRIQYTQNHMIINLNIQSESSDLTPWLALTQYRKHIYSHPQAFQPHYLRVIHDGICNDECQALFKAEKYIDTLYDEIQKRKKIRRNYSHEQVWYVFVVLARLAYHIHHKGPKWIIGNLHPRNILINSDGQIQVITLNSLPYQTDHFQIYRKQGIHSAYLSPELLGFTFERQFQQFPKCINRQLSQTFTFALTMLSITQLMTDFSLIYDTTFFSYPSKMTESHNRNSSIHKTHTLTGLLNHNQLDLMIRQVHQKYCPLLAVSLKAMLHPDPSERISISTIYKQILQPNQGFILGMELSWLGTAQLRQLTQEQRSQTFSEQAKNSTQYL